MIRIPEGFIKLAREKVVETKLRLYVVGTYADYVLGYTAKVPDDLDILVTGPAHEHKELEEELVRAVKGTGDKAAVVTRTSFGGLRIVRGDGTKTDIFHFPDLAAYMSRVDKGSGYVVDAATGVAFKRLAESSVPAAVTVNDDTSRAPHYISVPHRETPEDTRRKVDALVRQMVPLSVGTHKIAVKSGDAVKSWFLTVFPEKPKAAETVVEKKPEQKPDQGVFVPAAWPPIGKTAEVKADDVKPQKAHARIFGTFASYEFDLPPEAKGSIHGIEARRAATKATGARANQVVTVARGAESTSFTVRPGEL